MTQLINCYYTHSTFLVTSSCFRLQQLMDNQKLWRTTRNYNLIARATTPFIFLTQTLLQCAWSKIYHLCSQFEKSVVMQTFKCIMRMLPKVLQLMYPPGEVYDGLIGKKIYWYWALLGTCTHPDFSDQLRRSLIMHYHCDHCKVE